MTNSSLEGNFAKTRDVFTAQRKDRMDGETAMLWLWLALNAGKLDPRANVDEYRHVVDDAAELEPVRRR